MKKFVKMVQKKLDGGELTITQLAIDAKCSRQHIYNILSGKSELTLGVAEKIAKACGFRIQVGNLEKVPK